MFYDWNAVFFINRQKMIYRPVVCRFKKKNTSIISETRQKSLLESSPRTDSLYFMTIFSSFFCFSWTSFSSGNRRFQSQSRFRVFLVIQTRLRPEGWCYIIGVVAEEALIVSSSCSSAPTVSLTVLYLNSISCLLLTDLMFLQNKILQTLFNSSAVLMTLFYWHLSESIFFFYTFNLQACWRQLELNQ